MLLIEDIQYKTSARAKTRIRHIYRLGQYQTFDFKEIGLGLLVLKTRLCSSLRANDNISSLSKIFVTLLNKEVFDQHCSYTLLCSIVVIYYCTESQLQTAFSIIRYKLKSWPREQLGSIPYTLLSHIKEYFIFRKAYNRKRVKGTHLKLSTNRDHYLSLSLLIKPSQGIRKYTALYFQYP